MSDTSSTLKPSAQCAVAEQWRGRTVVLSCAGVIDSLTTPLLERGIAAALDQSPEALIVDLSGVEFLASQGMGVLVATSDLCAPTIGFSVVADGATSGRQMRLIGLGEVFDLHDDLDEALEQRS